MGVHPMSAFEDPDIIDKADEKGERKIEIESRYNKRS